MRAIRRHEVRAIRPEEFGGEVTVYVRTATVVEYGEVGALPYYPASEADRAEVEKVLGRHVDNISGLLRELATGEEPPAGRKVEEIDGARFVETKSLGEGIRHLPTWCLAAVYRAVLRGSTLSPDDLSKSGPRSSGGGSIAGSTAPVVDPED